MNKDYFEQYKRIAAEKLPSSLYEQLAPHLEGLLGEILDAKQGMEFYDCEDAKNAAYRMQGLRIEFQKKHRSEWAKFARERWPDVDEHYNPEHIHPFFDDVGFD